MRARLVLEDCRLTLGLLDHVQSEGMFRVLWVALVTLLRAVGHVLDKVDGNADPAMRRAVDEAWKACQERREADRIFWAFIDHERNAVLKTYEMTPPAGDVVVGLTGQPETLAFVLDENIFKPLLDGPYAGEDARDVAGDAIAWWDRHLSAVAATADRISSG